MSHSNPIALVTGANRGLGKEVSRQLAEQGYTVIVTSRSLQNAQSAVEELKGNNLIAAQLDVANPDSIKQLSEQVLQQFGRIDVLVNNAAIHYDTWQSAYNADMNTVQEAMQTDVYGAWRMVQTFLPLLRKSAHPRIVNVSSGGGALNGMSGGTPAYSVTKASLNALTLMLADELKREKFLVNAVCPGWVATDMGGFGGRPVKDGASGIVWAATLPVNGPTGGFFRDGKRIDW
ncbi:SDR family oxidoreductase [Vibrio sp. SCSIO 43137]|uniref:SDR family oxidoreductase n=1 Tax=Vibrio sp. SCSIO 43137 TaxID=3021011 RepID=UPI0023073189|nr:SDR family oxidoreductase [Vibrio sp. SCSIO 43137]WCE32529.1 SDR family oxidoreductase [Vibrio sp. SCSIO 43137]